MKKLGPHIRDRAHQQAPSASALDGQLFSTSVMLRDQVFSARDEIRKRVLLLLHAPGVMPRFPEFATAANMRNSKDRAAVEQAQPIRIEINRHRDSVAAVTVKQQRGSCIARSVAPADHRDRNARAVVGRGMQTFAHILRRIVATKDWLLLAKSALTRADVVIKHGSRSDKRFVLEAHVRSIELRIVAEGSVVGRL